MFVQVILSFLLSVCESVYFVSLNVFLLKCGVSCYQMTSNIETLISILKNLSFCNRLHLLAFCVASPFSGALIVQHFKMWNIKISSLFAAVRVRLRLRYKKSGKCEKKLQNEYWAWAGAGAWAQVFDTCKEKKVQTMHYEQNEQETPDCNNNSFLIINFEFSSFFQLFNLYIYFFIYMYVRMYA